MAMLALNAFFLPYRGWQHDAILYGMQVANRVEGGRFADDLFFRFGSQDKVFPLLAVAVARWLG